MKQHTDPVLGEVAVAPGTRLEELDSAVGAFGGSVRDAVLRVGKQPRKMTLQSLRGSDDQFEARVIRPEVPAVEKLFLRTGVMIVPELSKRLLDRPRATGLQRLDPEGLETPAPALRPAPGVLEPDVLRSGERLLALGLEAAVLLAAHEIDRFVQFLRTAELVMDGHGLGADSARRFQVCLLHVHRAGGNPLASGLRDRDPEHIGRFPGALRSHVEDPFADDVAQDGDIVMPTLETLLIEPGVA